MTGKRKLLEKVLAVTVSGEELQFSDVKPKERQREIIAEFGGVR